MRKKTVTRIVIYGVIVALLSSIGYGLFVLVNQLSSERTDPTVFTTEKWKYGNSRNRHLMLDDLYSKYDLYSMTKDEIEDLLGDGGHPPSLEGPNEYYYQIAVEYYDSETLHIHFDGDGKVIEIVRMRS